MKDPSPPTCSGSVQSSNWTKVGRTPLQRPLSAQEQRHLPALRSLLAERADLRGVHPLADILAEAIHWSA